MYFRLPAKLAGMEEILPEDENERQSYYNVFKYHQLINISVK
jgi:hypothetical protein